MAWKQTFDFRDDWGAAVVKAGHSNESWGICGSRAAHDKNTGVVIGEWIVDGDCNNGTSAHGWLMSNEKQFTIVKRIVHYRGNREDSVSEVTGTLEYLVDYHSYTLECCPRPKNGTGLKPITTIKSFISRLNKSYEYKEAACYTRTSVELKAK